MKLSSKERYSYQIPCDENTKVLACNVMTNIELYGDGKYLATSTDVKQISLDEMKKIVSQLKG